eukprot:g41.t1
MRFTLIERIGHGAFGEVFRACDPRDGAIVALKKIRLRRIEDGLPINTFRELRALQELCHPNVVQLLEVVADGAHVVLVMEYMTSDLAHIIAAADGSLPAAAIKAFAQMMFRGLEHLHSHRIVHRDIKPSNLLVSATGQLKLADFGLARPLGAAEVMELQTSASPVQASATAAVASMDRPQYSHQVQTRWYRAPEILFGAHEYDSAIDMWGAGAVLGEMLAGAPLFAGQNDIDQIYKVLQVLGTPTQESWPGHECLPDYSKISFPRMGPVGIQFLLGGQLPRKACELVALLLRWDPTHRLCARAALHHTFFFVAPRPMRCVELRAVVHVSTQRAVVSEQSEVESESELESGSEPARESEPKPEPSKVRPHLRFQAFLNAERARTQDFIIQADVT